MVELGLLRKKLQFELGWSAMIWFGMIRCEMGWDSLNISFIPIGLLADQNNIINHHLKIYGLPYFRELDIQYISTTNIPEGLDF